MKKHKRARQPEEKMIKRDAILKAAWDLFENAGGMLPTVSRVARASRVSKGGVYLYFRTKEELFYSLFEMKIQGWFQQLEKEICRFKIRMEVSDLARILTTAALMEPLVFRLGSITKGFMDASINENIAYEANMRLVRLATSGGAMVARHIPGLSVKDASRMLLCVYAFVFGLWQNMSTPPGILKRMAANGIDLFKPFEAEYVTEAVSDLLHGFIHGRCPVGRLPLKKSQKPK